MSHVAGPVASVLAGWQVFPADDLNGLIPWVADAPFKTASWSQDEVRTGGLGLHLLMGPMEQPSSPFPTPHG